MTIVRDALHAPTLPPRRYGVFGCRDKALERHQDAVAEFRTMLRPTLRGSLFNAAASIAAGNVETARASVMHALVINPDIDEAWLRALAPFRQTEQFDKFCHHLRLAGLTQLDAASDLELSPPVSSGAPRNP